MGPPRRSSPWVGELSDEEVERALELWDAGLDTFDIADKLFRHEAAVERGLRVGRERRRLENAIRGASPNGDHGSSSGC